MHKSNKIAIIKGCINSKSTKGPHFIKNAFNYLGPFTGLNDYCCRGIDSAVILTLNEFVTSILFKGNAEIGVGLMVFCVEEMGNFIMGKLFEKI